VPSTLALAWSCAVCIVLVELFDPYLGPASTGLFLALGLCAAVALLPAAKPQMRSLDWCALAIAAAEIPSLIFSQYRANSIRTSWAVLISVLVYYAVRLTIKTAPQVALLSGLLGLGGAWLALTGLGQFQTHASELAGAGLTDLVAFRSRLMTPPAPWVLGEWLTVLLMALPFACALPAWLWQTRRNWLAAIALAPPVAIAATLSLSCSRAVFWSMVLFCFVACAFMAAGRIVRLKSAGLMLASALAALGLILAAECALYPGVFEAYAGRHASQVRSTEGRLGIWKRSAGLVRHAGARLDRPP
jgi:hypothetical protein